MISLVNINPMQLLYVQPDVLSKRSPTMEPCSFRYLLPRTW